MLLTVKICYLLEEKSDINNFQRNNRNIWVMTLNTLSVTYNFITELIDCIFGSFDGLTMALADIRQLFLCINQLPKLTSTWVVKNKACKEVLKSHDGDSFIYNLLTVM